MMFALAGCWINGLFIKNLDNLLEHKITSRLYLYHSQQEKLEKDVSKFLNDSRALAPQIQKKLDFYQEQIKAGQLSAKKVQKEFEFWQSVANKKLENIASKHIGLLAGLNQEQQKHFFEEMEEKNQEKKEKIAKKLMERIFERFEFYFDELNEQQKKVLNEEKDFFFKRDKQRLKDAKAFQKQLKALYEENAKLAQFKKLAKKSIHELFSAERTKKHATIVHKLIEASDKQGKKNLLKKLSEFKGWIKTFQETKY
ncbi:MAG: hypothetical protein WD025_00475 [Bacteriovoracaceae bacterium]